MRVLVQQQRQVLLLTYSRSSLLPSWQIGTRGSSHAAPLLASLLLLLQVAALRSWS
jgi:hypothetical protein